MITSRLFSIFSNNQRLHCMKRIENCTSIADKMLEKEFSDVYQHCKGKIERKAFYLTGSKQQVEDITQEVFLKLWLKWPVLNSMQENELEDYIYAMVKNHILNLQKKESRKSNNMRGYAETQGNGYWPDEIVLTEGFKIYTEAIDQLPSKEKEVYLLYDNDFNCSMIANKMQRSKNTINNQVYSAAKSVKDYLRKKLNLNIRCDGRKIFLRAA